MGQEDTSTTQGGGIPGFARDFPRDAQLDALLAAFARGDYAAVRRGARALAAATADASVQRAARTLIERTETDPLALGLLGLGGMLLVIVSAWWVAHGHPPH